jgi:hypothetical protein
MHVLRRARLSVLIGVAIGLAAGGIAYASIPGPGGVIHGCYLKQGGNLRVVDSAASCKSSEGSLSWNQRGVTGATGTSGAAGTTGATGPSGPTGPAGSVRAWAFIVLSFNPPSASIARGHNVAAVARGAAGTYCVLLDPSIDVTTAGVVVTPSGGGTGANANADGCILNNLHGIIVHIFDTATETGVDPGGFTLVVP